MDIEILLTTVAGLIAGGGIGSLFTLRAQRKKADLDNESTAVETLKDAISEVRVSNDKLIALHDKDGKVIQEKDERILELSKDLVACQMMLCKHDSCPFREPAKGRGVDWFKSHQKDDDLTDHENIYDIVNRYGYTLKLKSE